MPDLLINPAADALGRVNAVLSGKGRRYESRGFAGPLSIKGVIRGSAVWETPSARFEVTPRTALILNDGEEYAITVDAPQPVETFCVFFARGFVDDAVRALTTSSERLLDASEAPAVAFFERLHFDDALTRELECMHERFTNGEPLEVFTLAAALANAECDAVRRASRLPALKATTRDELRRRIARSTAFLHAAVDRDVTVADAASEACLSPFHFHRLFAAFHGETPHRYLTRLRLARARALLRGSERPIAEVAAACGFESVGSFTTLFTRAFGVPPGRFRRIREDDAAAAR